MSITKGKPERALFLFVPLLALYSCNEFIVEQKPSDRILSNEIALDTSLTLGDSQLRLPKQDGYVNCFTNAWFRDLTSNLEPPSIKPLAFYIPPESCSQENFDLSVNKPKKYFKVSILKEFESKVLKQQWWKRMKEKGFSQFKGDMDWEKVRVRLRERYGSDIMEDAFFVGKYQVTERAFVVVNAVKYQDVNESFTILKADCFVHCKERLLQVIHYAELSEFDNEYNIQKSEITEFIQNLGVLN